MGAINEKYVRIKESELNQLRADSRFLTELENAGVDNWQGMEFAEESYEEKYGEDYYN